MKKTQRNALKLSAQTLRQLTASQETLVAGGRINLSFKLVCSDFGECFTIVPACL